MRAESRAASRIGVGTCLIAAVALATIAGGCVQRRLTIRSNPPGAVVYVDNQEIGTTPCSTDFLFYGTRQFRLVKDGYETLKTERFISPPFYQIFPLDFVSENVVPWEIRDERSVDFDLQPQVIVPTQALLGRAQDLRQGTNARAAALVVPAGVPQPASVAPPSGMVAPGVLPPPSAPITPMGTMPAPSLPPGPGAGPPPGSVPPAGAVPVRPFP